MQVFTMLLVTIGGLLGLLMSPDELIGDRCAQILVAVLILITSIQVRVARAAERFPFF